MGGAPRATAPIVRWPTRRSARSEDDAIVRLARSQDCRRPLYIAQSEPRTIPLPKACDQWDGAIDEALRSKWRAFWTIWRATDQHRKYFRRVNLARRKALRFHAKGWGGVRPSEATRSPRCTHATQDARTTIRHEPARKIRARDLRLARSTGRRLYPQISRRWETRHRRAEA